MRRQATFWTALEAAVALLTALLLAAPAVAQGQGSGGGKGQGGSEMHGGGSGAGAGHGGVPGSRATEADDDSDRPPWAQGNREENPHAQGGGPPEGSGTMKGDLYGDLVVILRDENGEPILTAEGWVQPLDADGNLVPLDAEGEPIDESLLVEVDLGRLSVVRAPSKVTAHALDEALDKLDSATLIELDAAGRLVVDGVAIDSPLENIALYDFLMSGGTLPDGVVLPADFDVAALLGTAADKTGLITVDVLVYENSILGINQISPDGTVVYYDFATYDYDRAASFDGTVTYLKDEDGDGTYEQVTESILDAVFGGETWTDTTAGGADDFAQAADDTRAVIDFLHSVPTVP